MTHNDHHVAVSNYLNAECRRDLAALMDTLDYVEYIVQEIHHRMVAGALQGQGGYVPHKRSNITKRLGKASVERFFYKGPLMDPQ